MNSIRKTKKNLLLSTKTYISTIVNYSYTTIMLVNFHLNKRFFLHDITLIASVVGESVISSLAMVLVGSLSQLKWCDLLKASRWSKRLQKLVTRSYSHSNGRMATRSKYVYTPRSMGNSYKEYPPPH